MRTAKDLSVATLLTATSMRIDFGFARKSGTLANEDPKDSHALHDPNTLNGLLLVRVNSLYVSSIPDSVELAEDEEISVKIDCNSLMCKSS